MLAADGDAEGVVRSRPALLGLPSAPQMSVEKVRCPQLTPLVCGVVCAQFMLLPCILVPCVLVPCVLSACDQYQSDSHHQGTRGEVLSIPAGAAVAFGPPDAAHTGYVLVHWAAGGPQGVAQWVLLSRACAVLWQLQQDVPTPPMRLLLLAELQHTAACVAAMGRADPSTLQELLQEGMRVPIPNAGRGMDLIDVLAKGLAAASQVHPPPLATLAALLQLATACAAVVPGRAVAAALGSPLLAVTQAALFGRPLGEGAAGVGGWAAVFVEEQRLGNYPVTMAALELLSAAATRSALPDAAVRGNGGGLLLTADALLKLPMCVWSAITFTCACRCMCGLW